MDLHKPDFFIYVVNHKSKPNRFSQFLKPKKHQPKEWGPSPTRALKNQARPTSNFRDYLWLKKPVSQAEQNGRLWFTSITAFAALKRGEKTYVHRYVRRKVDNTSFKHSLLLREQFWWRSQKRSVTLIGQAQGCQMVYFKTKNANMCIFWRPWKGKCWYILRPFGLIYGHLV
jgi:hypothetical protein